jgi:hypothetical protein
MSPGPLGVLVAIAAGISKIGPYLEALKAYQAERQRLIDQYGQQAAERLPDVAATIAEGQRRLDDWDSDIDRREARLEALRRTREAAGP